MKRELKSTGQSASYFVYFSYGHTLDTRKDMSVCTGCNVANKSKIQTETTTRPLFHTHTIHKTVFSALCTIVIGAEMSHTSVGDYETLI